MQTKHAAITATTTKNSANHVNIILNHVKENIRSFRASLRGDNQVFERSDYLFIDGKLDSSGFLLWVLLHAVYICVKPVP